MTTSTNSPVSPGTTAMGVAGQQKDFSDFLGQLIPSIATTAAPSLGIDPRVAGQTVSQILSIFGIGGPGKAFTPGLPKDQAVSQLQQVVGPHLSDPAFKTALVSWLQAAIEPTKEYQAGKAFNPDLTKDWFGDAINSIGHAVSSVNWGQVTQVGMQALPFALSLF